MIRIFFFAINFDLSLLIKNIHEKNNEQKEKDIQLKAENCNS